MSFFQNAVLNKYLKTLNTAMVSKENACHKPQGSAGEQNPQGVHLCAIAQGGKLVCA